MSDTCIAVMREGDCGNPRCGKWPNHPMHHMEWAGKCSGCGRSGYSYHVHHPYVPTPPTLCELTELEHTGRRVIFLDIDGVLNRATTTERFQGYIGLDAELVRRFNVLLEHANADVVLSSTWRLYPDHLNAVKEVIPIVDVTPNLEHFRNASRGAEIQAWMDVNDPLGRYAIIDDDTDMLDGQTTFFTSPDAGLTSQVARLVAVHFAAVAHTFRDSTAAYKEGEVDLEKAQGYLRAANATNTRRAERVEVLEGALREIQELEKSKGSPDTCNRNAGETCPLSHRHTDFRVMGIVARVLSE